MADILFVREFVTGELHFLGVDNDDVVSAIDVGSETRLVLTAQDLGDLRSKTAQYHIRRVDQNPFLGRGRRIDGNRFVA